MEQKINTGLKHSASKMVRDEDSAIHYGSGLAPVFATPAMIAFIEQTANNSIVPLLDNGDISVGTEVNIKHLRATKIGATVKCKTEVIACDGKKITFNAEVWDNHQLVGHGTHTRFIVNKKKFLENI